MHKTPHDFFLLNAYLISSIFYWIHLITTVFSFSINWTFHLIDQDTNQEFPIRVSTFVRFRSKLVRLHKSCFIVPLKCSQAIVFERPFSLAGVERTRQLRSRVDLFTLLNTIRVKLETSFFFCCTWMTTNGKKKFIARVQQKKWTAEHTGQLGHTGSSSWWKAAAESASLEYPELSSCADKT